MNSPEKQLYIPHSGTILVSGCTEPLGAAACAQRYLADQSKHPVEFVSIGAGATNQSVKAIARLLLLFNQREKELLKCIAAQPRMYRIHLNNDPTCERVAVVFRIVVFQAEEVQLTPETANVTKDVVC